MNQQKPFEKSSNDNDQLILLLVGPFKDDLDTLRKQTKKITENNKHFHKIFNENNKMHDLI